jgi:hypothetical protein
VAFPADVGLARPGYLQPVRWCPAIASAVALHTAVMPEPDHAEGMTLAEVLQMLGALTAAGGRFWLEGGGDEAPS